MMGILNVTPDSFWDGGRWFETRQAIMRGHEMIAEQSFAHIDVRPGETMSGGGQFDVAFLNLGEAKQLQGFGHREKFVDFHLQSIGERGKVGAAQIGLGRDFLDHSGQRIG